MGQQSLRLSFVLLALTTIGLISSHVHISFVRESVVMSYRSKEHFNTNQEILKTGRNVSNIIFIGGIEYVGNHSRVYEYGNGNSLAKF